MELNPLKTAAPMPGEDQLAAIVAFFNNAEAIQKAHGEFDAKREEANQAIAEANELIADITVREQKLVLETRALDTRSAAVEREAKDNDLFAEKLQTDKNTHEKKTKQENKDAAAKAKDLREREERLVAREAQAADDLEEARDMKAAAEVKQADYETKLGELEAITQRKAC